MNSKKFSKSRPISSESSNKAKACSIDYNLLCPSIKNRSEGPTCSSIALSSLFLESDPVIEECFWIEVKIINLWNKLAISKKV